MEKWYRKEKNQTKVKKSKVKRVLYYLLNPIEDVTLSSKSDQCN